MRIPVIVGIALSVLLGAIANARDLPRPGARTANDAADSSTPPITILMPHRLPWFEPIGRAMAQRMSERLGKPMTVEVGSRDFDIFRQIARAPADGYTIALVSANEFTRALGYGGDVLAALKNVKPITRIAKVSQVLAVAPDLPVSNLQEFVDYAKARPGELNAAIPDTAYLAHLATVLFANTAGVDVRLVRFMDAVHSDRYPDGPIKLHMMLHDLPVPVPVPEADKSRLIAVASRARSEAAKDLPTAAELGMPQVEAEHWFGLIAPAATPPAVIAELHAAAAEAVHHPSVTQQFAKVAATMVGDTPEEFDAFIKSEIEKWGLVVQQAGIKQN